MGWSCNGWAGDYPCGSCFHVVWIDAMQWGLAPSGNYSYFLYLQFISEHLDKYV